MKRQDIADHYLKDLQLQACDAAKNEEAIEFLKQLQSRHVATHSFNSLGVVMGGELSLALEDLYQKIVLNRRGGYCFEHNKLIYEVLEELGFKVQLSLARVTYNREVDAPRTHRITLVTVGSDTYVVDGGFGHLGARFPVKLECGVSQPQGNESFRIVEKDRGHYCFQTLKEGEFFTLYTFDRNTYTDSDCLLGHFYSHRHPDAAFVNNLVVSRKFSDCIHSLRNGDFHVIRENETSVTQLADRDALHEVLTETFELEVNVAVSGFLFSKFIAQQS
ncbi:arylamine N-acetyltransferase family protein [Pseudoteredinibacter isoporae]|uniref:arylamine N-acetyltransferase family protein n=1 Tax=Pseudoteredinibacter isoporae TaxID=570281 RepID=UPI0033401E98